jgi:soluble lytic murein transglycosylase
MTTAVVARLRERQRHAPGRWIAGALILAACAVGAVIIHVTMPSWYARVWYPMEHAAAIKAEAAAFEVDADLIAAVIYRESKFGEDARSTRGAVGLMQVLPETAQWIHRQSLAPAAPPERLAEPEVNIAYGAWYLHYLIEKYGSQDLALAAYNGGETNLQAWVADANRHGHPLDMRSIPFSETRSFVAAVHDARAVYRRAWPDTLGLS